MPGPEPGHDLCLLQRAVPRSAEILLLGSRDRHARAAAHGPESLGEQLLDGHGPAQGLVRPQVCDAKAPFAQYSLHHKLAGVQRCARRECRVGQRSRHTTGRASRMVGGICRAAIGTGRWGHGAPSRQGTSG